MPNPTLDPWTVSVDDFPSGAPAAERLAFLLNYAIIAPSSHNSQPWLFHVDGDSVELHADRTRALATVDPDDRELTMSCGAALQHLRLAMRHFCCLGEVETFPDPRQPDLLARVRLGDQGGATAEEHAMFQAIPVRRTNRRPFEHRPVPRPLLERLRAAAADEGARLHVVEDELERFRVAALVAEGDRSQFADRRFRRELASWIHPNRTRSRDGMPGRTQGVGDVTSMLVPWVIRTFDVGDGQAAKDQELVEGSPVLAVLRTDHENPQAWLAAGQAVARVLLRARADNVWGSFLNQAVEVPELRMQLNALLGRGGFPQLLLRLGYGPEVRPTPRRPLGEVLI